MASFGSRASVCAQLARDPAFVPVIAYLDELGRSGSAARERVAAIAAGETRRIELAGGAFALEQAYQSKPRADGFFESHAKFIDIQVVVEGEEWMEVADVGAMQVERPLDPGRDLIVYRDNGGASRLHLHSGEAAVFFPADVHMPGLCGAGIPTLVRKAVVKVPVAR